MERHDSKDWQKGDLALCTHQGPWFSGSLYPTNYGPKSGGVYTVDQVEVHEHPFDGPTQCLRFPEWSDSIWSSKPFVKINPPPVGELLDEDVYNEVTA